MSALCDVDITTLLGAKPSLSDAIPPGDERIKRASLDLTIGKIFLPETPPGNLGGINNPRQKTPLSQGQTALIETAEIGKVADRYRGSRIPSGERHDQRTAHDQSWLGGSRL